MQSAENVFTFMVVYSNVMGTVTQKHVYLLLAQPYFPVPPGREVLGGMDVMQTHVLILVTV